jgi:BirA family transcriptional regulator, biotin operon repressor / biotin---[acetyl-CoA-carboxylase] ligase
MIRIKLDAIDSTNDFLKKLSLEESTKNYTVVTAESQTNGKGQMGSKWFSESGKNLIVSILIKNVISDINEIFNLNFAVALSIIETLDSLNIPELTIKWPNDILSGNKKIGGILIENIIKSDNSIHSIIGLGLNINQINFVDLPNASSLKIIMNQDFNKNKILDKIIDNFRTKIIVSKKNDKDLLRNSFNNRLYKKGLITTFVSNNDCKFMGIIQEVTKSGKLKLLIENDIIQEFDIKEIAIIY